MLKRTKGRLLITLLIVTGLAGTMNDSSVTLHERKQALMLLKESKNELLEEVAGLSEKQLNYKSSETGQSIKNYLQQVATSEKKMWLNITEAMKLPANPEKRLEINYTDNQLISLTETSTILSSGSNTFKQAMASWKTANDAIVSFKNMRNDHIKYMKTSTEDLRNHVINTEAGWIDSYQYILIMATESQCIIKNIQALKANLHFPEK